MNETTLDSLIALNHEKELAALSVLLQIRSK